MSTAEGQHADDIAGYVAERGLACQIDEADAVMLDHILIGRHARPLAITISFICRSWRAASLTEQRGQSLPTSAEGVVPSIAAWCELTNSSGRPRPCADHDRDRIENLTQYADLRCPATR
jgi:hypothetical protein